MRREQRPAVQTGIARPRKSRPSAWCGSSCETSSTSAGGGTSFACLDLPGLLQHALIEVQDDLSALGGDGVVRDQQHGLTVLAHESVEKCHDVIGALPVE